MTGPGGSASSDTSRNTFFEVMTYSNDVCKGWKWLSMDVDRGAILYRVKSGLDMWDISTTGEIDSKNGNRSLGG